MSLGHFKRHKFSKPHTGYKLTVILRHTSASLSCSRVLTPQSAVSKRQCDYTVSSCTDMSSANEARTRDLPCRNWFYRPYRTELCLCVSSSLHLHFS